MSVLQHLKKALLISSDLIFPNSCTGCGDSLDELTDTLCNECAQDIAHSVGGDYCCSCGEDRGPHMLIQGKCVRCYSNKPGPRFKPFVRVGPYRGALSHLILRFKREFVLDRMLGEMLANAIAGRLDPTTIDAWVPIPTHWRRQIARGFHPAHLLARAAVEPWRGRVYPCLAMTRHIAPFHRGVSAAERARRIEGAFRVRTGMDVREKRICLIDDVTTTGATLAEARRVLYQAGAQSVAAAVLAKTGPLDAPVPAIDRAAASP